MRNYGADCFRILCCVGALVYHVTEDIIGMGIGGAHRLYFSAAYTAILIICSLFVGLEITAECFKKMPVLRNLV